MAVIVGIILIFGQIVIDFHIELDTRIVSALELMQVDHVVALRSEGEDDLANMLPACRSCNHYKRGNSLEGWRRILEAMPATLERDCYTYRQAVRFGMVKPTPKKITFCFERRCI